MAAALVTLALATPASAGDPLAPLPATPQSNARMHALTAQFPGATGELAARLLAAHNRERALVGHPPLAWDPDLAASAASYGPTLASLGRLVHSPRETRPGQRENLAKAWHGTLTPEQLVDLWSREKLMLQPGLFPAVSRTGQWEDVAHYTQMVWPTTKPGRLRGVRGRLGLSDLPLFAARQHRRQAGVRFGSGAAGAGERPHRPLIVHATELATGGG